MNTPNILAQIEQEQRIANDRIAQIEKDTNLYYSGKEEGSSGKFRPSCLEEEFYQGWSDGYRQWCLSTQHLVEYGGTVNNQGYLLASYEQIKAKFGEIWQIEDYDGWQVNLNFLDIEIITFDSENPKSETVWHIHSNHISALRELGEIFGLDKVMVKKPKEALSFGQDVA